MFLLQFIVLFLLHFSQNFWIQVLIFYMKTTFTFRFKCLGTIFICAVKLINVYFLNIKFIYLFMCKSHYWIVNIYNRYLLFLLLIFDFVIILISIYSLILCILLWNQVTFSLYIFEYAILFIYIFVLSPIELTHIANFCIFFLVFPQNHGN